MTALLAALLLSGPGPTLADIPREKSALEVDATNGAVFGLRWFLPVVRRGMDRTVISSFGQPGISERHDLVIVAQGEGRVLAYDLNGGREVWQYAHKIPFETSVTILPPTNSLPELALVIGRDGEALALVSETGEPQWEANVGTGSRAPSRRVGDVVLVTTVDNRLHALDIATGESLWSVGCSPPTGLTVEGHSAATVHGQVVYVTFGDGYIEAFQLADGTSLWSRPLSFKGTDFIDADADPIIVDDRIYVASYSDGVYALSVTDGKTIWHQAAPAVTSLARYDGDDRELVVAASADGYVWGLERFDGTMAYRTRLPPGPTSRLLVRDNILLMTAGESGLLVLNAYNGRPVQATAVPGTLGCDPAWEGDHVAVLSSQGQLLVFGLDEDGRMPSVVESKPYVGQWREMSRRPARFRLDVAGGFGVNIAGQENVALSMFSFWIPIGFARVAPRLTLGHGVGDFSNPSAVFGGGAAGELVFEGGLFGATLGVHVDVNLTTERYFVAVGEQASLNIHWDWLELFTRVELDHVFHGDALSSDAADDVVPDLGVKVLGGVAVRF